MHRYAKPWRATWVLLAVLAWSPAWADAPLQLDAAIQRALANNADLAVAQARLQEARSSRGKITTAWLPNVAAVGSYTHNSVEAKFDSGKLITGVVKIINPSIVIPADKLPEPSYIQRAETVQGVIQVDQTVFALSPLLLAEAADTAISAQQQGLEAARRELVFQIHQVYYNYAGVLRLLQVAERAMALADQRIAMVQQRKGAGADSELAVLRASSERDRAAQDRLRAESARRQLLVILGALLGEPAPGELGPVPEQKEPTGDMDQWLSAALKDRPDLASRRKMVEALQLQVREAQWRWTPMLAVQWLGRWSNVAGFAGQNAVWSATANLVVPIFDRGVRYAEAAERQSALARTHKELDKALADVRTVLQQAALDLEQARQTLTLSLVQVERAKRTAEIAGKSYAAGGATSLELAEADTNLRAAEASVERDRIGVDLAILRLRHATGELRAP